MKKRKLYIWRATKRVLTTLFLGLMIVYLIAGSQISWNFQPDRAKANIWDKVKKGIGVAKEVASIVK